MFVIVGVMLVLWGVVGKVGVVLVLIFDFIVGGILLLGFGMVVFVGILGRFL